MMNNLIGILLLFCPLVFGQDASIDENSILPKAEIFASSIVNDKLVDLKGMKLLNVLKKSMEKVNKEGGPSLVQISFVLEVGETFCDKNETFIDSCPLDITKPHRICQLTILYSNEAFVLPDEEEIVCNVLEVVEEPLSTEKYPCLGCPVDLEIGNPEIRILLENTLPTIEGKSNRYITKIIRAQSQVVAGMKYYIDFVAAVPDCSPDVKKDSQFHCVISEESYHDQCHIEIWQRPWLDSTEVLAIDCVPYTATSETTFEVKSTESSQIDVEVETTTTIPHSIDNIIDELLEFGFVNEDINEDEYKVVDSKTMPVDGQTIYHFNLLDDTDTSCDLDVHVDCNGTKSSTSNCTQGWVVGDIVDVNTDDGAVQEYLDFAQQYVVGGYNKSGNLKFHLVESAQQQAVSGTLFHFIMKFTNSCEDSKEECSENIDRSEISCKIKLLYQPWNNNKQILGSDCSNESLNKVRRRRSMPGGMKPVKSAHTAERLANKAISHLTGVAGYPSGMKLKQIMSVQYQVVSGLLYKLVIEIDVKNCSVSQETNEIDCQNRQICKFYILEQAWKGLSQVQKFSCHRRLSKSYHDSSTMKLATIDFFKSEFMKKYNKTYGTVAEMHRRFRIFRRNMLKVDHLQATERGTAKYGPTFFADLTEEEFRARYLGVNPALKKKSKLLKPADHVSCADLPPSFDWREKGVVTPVKNQGMCGSCWAFSVVGNIESQYAIQTGKLYSLSEQELVDCDKLDQGCNGGYPSNAYEVIKDMGGLETEDDYPYDAHDETCTFNSSEVMVSVSGAVNISSNETEMAAWLVNGGPISVALNANAMQFYFGGVSHPLRFLCSPDSVDHAVLIVGYGVHTSTIFKRTLPYWLIKNSWGTFWGEKGYYRLYRGDGSCGINTMASSAIVESLLTPA